jgi:hypothetical protein
MNYSAKNRNFFSTLIKRIILLLIIATLLILISISCKKEAEITTNRDTTIVTLDLKPNEWNTFDFLIGVFIYNQTTKNFEITSANLTIQYGHNDSIVIPLATKTNQITIRDDTSNYIIKVTKQDYTSYSATFTSAELKSKFNSPLIVVMQSIANPLNDYEIQLLYNEKN